MLAEVWYCHWTLHCSTALLPHSHSTVMYWIQSKKRWLSPFRDPKPRVSDPFHLRCSPLNKLNFHLKRQTDPPRSPIASCSLSFPTLLSFMCPPSCSPGPDKGRLHKSVTQEIPTLYFLSDKEPVTGDEFVAAGGFDRLQGNNKAISVCQKSQRKEKQREEKNHTCGRYKSLLWWVQFFLWKNETVKLHRDISVLIIEEMWCRE